MDTLGKLLQAAQAATDPPTVVALADRLGVSRQTIYTWKRGDLEITDEHLARLIEFAGAEPERAVDVRREHAKSHHERALWASLARRLGAAATLAAVALFIPSPASAADGIEAARTMHYAHLRRWARRLRTALHTLFRKPYGAAEHGPSPVLA